LGAEFLYVGFDDDKSGNEAASEAMKILDSFEIPTKRIVPASSKDFNEQLGKNDLDNIREASVGFSFAEFQLGF
jgi:adenylyl- and sulfurtransferase ThiI